MEIIEGIGCVNVKSIAITNSPRSGSAKLRWWYGTALQHTQFDCWYKYTELLINACIIMCCLYRINLYLYSLNRNYSIKTMTGSDREKTQYYLNGLIWKLSFWSGRQNIQISTLLKCVPPIKLCSSKNKSKTKNARWTFHFASTRLV